jgi:hypothetical protein
MGARRARVWLHVGGPGLATSPRRMDRPAIRRRGCQSTLRTAARGLRRRVDAPPHPGRLVFPARLAPLQDARVEDGAPVRDTRGSMPWQT